MLSILLYVFGVVGAVAALALIRPISRVGLSTRRRALSAWLAATAACVLSLTWPTHDIHVASVVSRLDEIVPVYQFSEVHEIMIDGPADRTYRAICTVTADRSVPLDAHASDL